ATVALSIKPLQWATPEDSSAFAPTSRMKAASLKKLAYETAPAAVTAPAFDDAIKTDQLKVEQPLAAAVKWAAAICKRQRADRLYPTAVVDPTATVKGNVAIGAYAVIGAGAVISERVTIHPHVVVYPGASIGADSEIHSGAVIREFVQL